MSKLRAGGKDMLFPREFPEPEELAELLQELELTDDVDFQKISLALRWVKILGQVEQQFEKALKSQDFSLARLHTLGFLIANGPSGGARPSEIADHLGVTRGSVTSLIDGLVKKGWIERQSREGDRRSLVITPTPEGRAAFKSIVPKHLARVRALFKHFGDENLAMAHANLSALQRALQETSDDA